MKVCLLINYFGQGAFLLTEVGAQVLGDQIPFFSIFAEQLLIVGVVVSTLATTIASQALITGVFSLVKEAMKLKLWPALRVRYPSESNGCTFLQSIGLLMTGSLSIVCHGTN